MNPLMDICPFILAGVALCRCSVWRCRRALRGGVVRDEDPGCDVAEVLASQGEAERLGIAGVSFYVFDGRSRAPSLWRF